MSQNNVIWFDPKFWVLDLIPCWEQLWNKIDSHGFHGLTTLINILIIIDTPYPSHKPFGVATDKMAVIFYFISHLIKNDRHFIVDKI